MNRPITRLISAFTTVALITTLAAADAVPPAQPASAQPVKHRSAAFSLKFIKLSGVDAKAGTYHSSHVNVTVMRPVKRTKVITVVVGGKPMSKATTYTVHVPEQRTMIQTYGKHSHNVYDGNGKLIPSDNIFGRIKNGQLVLLSSTPKIPKEYFKLLSKEAVVIAPKAKRPPKKK